MIYHGNLTITECKTVLIKLQCVILSPEIPSRWLPRARFDHQTHRFQSCGRCHDLRAATSADILALPKVETCRACHNRQGARARCVTCHPFHPN